MTVRLNCKQQAIYDACMKGESFLVIGQPLTGKTTLATQIFAFKIKESFTSDDCLILAPTNSQVKQIENILTTSVTSATKGQKVRTPSSYALHISQVWHNKRKDPIPDPEVTSLAKQNILVKEVINSKYDEIAENLHTDFISTEEFLRLTVDAVELCEDYDIKPELLKNIAQKVNKPNWYALGVILEEIEHRIDKESKTRTQGRIVSANRIQHYASYLLKNWDSKKHENQVYADLPLPKCIIVENLQDYTQSTFDLIRTLYGLGVQVILTVSPDQTVRSSSINVSKQIFDLAKELDVKTEILDEQYIPSDKISQLQKYIASQITTRTSLPYKETKVVDIYSQKELDKDLQEGIPISDNSADIKIFDNIYNEHKYIARWIREKNIIDKVSLKDIAVIVPSRQEKKFTQTLLHEYGVRCENTYESKILSKSPLIRVILETCIFISELSTLLKRNNIKQIVLKTNKNIAKEKQFLLDPIFCENVIQLIKSNPIYEQSVFKIANSSLVDIDLQTIKRIDLLLLSKKIKDSAENNVAVDSEKSRQSATSGIESDSGAENSIETVSDKNMSTRENADITNASAQDYIPTFVDLIFSNDIQEFCEENKNYLNRRLSEQLEILRKIIVSTLQVLSESQYNVERILWAVWSESKKDVFWCNQVLKEENGYEELDENLDDLIALFDQASWWTARHQRGTITGFCYEKLAEEIETDTVARLGIRPAGVRVLTPKETAGITYKNLVIKGLEKNKWPLRSMADYVYEKNLLSQIFDKEMTFEELESVSPVLQAEIINKDSWQTQLKLLLHSISRSTQNLLFTTIDNEETSPSIFIRMINNVLDRDIYTDDTEESFKCEKAIDTFDLKSHVVNVRRLLNQYLKNQAVPYPKQLLKEEKTFREKLKNLDNLEEELQSNDINTVAKVLNVLRSNNIEGTDYENWYRQLPITNFQPIVLDDEEIYLSPSHLDGIHACQMNWVLESKGGAASPIIQVQLTGNIIHGIAEKYPNITDENGNNLETKIRQSLDTEIEKLGLPDTHFNRKIVRDMNNMIDRYIEYIKLHPEKVETEKVISGKLTTSDGNKEFNIWGRVDRIEHVEDGKVIISDIKTGKSNLTKEKVVEHTQLGVYQMLFNSDKKNSEETLGARIIPLGTGKTLPIQGKIDFDSYRQALQDSYLGETYEQMRKNSSKIKSELKEKGSNTFFYFKLEEILQESFAAHKSPILLHDKSGLKCRTCEIIFESGADDE
ncbi:PD-(D/E)XK nuclease family protein [Actinomyces sp. zg-332]|uniref:PD-(D/E)XK nuclease family protein n=1 Tax=Actinomyces sp. zg-332 TaxID=2708340 RepID=UPI00141E5DD5|nr:PD-(D/E)XK nuclease family protein [Actinomyces sp. zg-332]QPK93960.1 PD-(D/E)XK nuclease family protein [Actinomyces sp. zg-332]